MWDYWAIAVLTITLIAVSITVILPIFRDIADSLHGPEENDIDRPYDEKFKR